MSRALSLAHRFSRATASAVASATAAAALQSRGRRGATMGARPPLLSASVEETPAADAPADVLTAPGSSPLWLRSTRSAAPLGFKGGFVELHDGTASADVEKVNCQPSVSERQGLTYAHCTFISPLCPNGPRVVVERALVDSGSSDCELLPGLLRRLGALPLVARGAIYETSIGGTPCDAYEVIVIVEGRACAAVVTASDEASSDEALLGHMSLGALGLTVDCLTRRLVPNASACRQPLQSVGAPLAQVLPPGACGATASSQVLRAVAPTTHAVAAPWLQDACFDEGLSRSREVRGELKPQWVRRNATAVQLEGVAEATVGEEAVQRGIEAQHCILGPAPIPVTYVRCEFASPLAPDGPKVVVHQALVDTGSADCELREGLFLKLGPLPVVARGLFYETVIGRVPHDSFEVIVSIAGRRCAASVTVTPEHRFAEDAEDPNSDEAVIGYAALAALGILVNCSRRTVELRE
eukprot:TRINITY_DN64191_c0_g1_i1.p1 TRINITY_DN64191_c0_g1~~TRINITY_DN64191_c0_g1_i1.p1  ORF type:complete len:469 (-),score=71.08 TRINITY_DN64191_c0_g1_i1:35-1441(-)